VGDIILEANRKKTETVRDLEKIINRADSGDSILLRIRRETRGRGEDFMVTLRIPE
jgi:S1-C subfamily serine protease